LHVGLMNGAFCSSAIILAGNNKEVVFDLDSKTPFNHFFFL